MRSFPIPKLLVQFRFVVPLLRSVFATGLIVLLATSAIGKAAAPPANDKVVIEQRLLKQAANNIEQYRKGDAVIEVVDAAGRPVAGAKISVNQVRHDFLFGCIAFSLVRARPDESLALFKRRFADLFNFAILPFYWAGYEPRPGQTMESQTRKAAQWCHEHGITTKGHPLVWSNRAGVPRWIARSEDALMRGALRRVDREVTAFKGQIDIWDVVNEPVNMRAWDDVESRNYTHAPIQRIAPYIEKSFGAARRANPDATLILNEFNLIPQPATRDRFFRLVHLLQERHVPVTGLGIQAHEPRNDWFAPQDVWDTLERLGSLGLPLHITEFIPQSSGKKITGNWRDGVWDETAQADYAEQIYRLAFGHPKVVSINWWGLSDRHIWLPNGGLVDRDYRPKAVYKRLLKLIHQEWTTRTTATSDAYGKATVRGFFGAYQVTVSAPSGVAKSFTCKLAPGQRNHWLLRVDP